MRQWQAPQEVVLVLVWPLGPEPAVEPVFVLAASQALQLVVLLVQLLVVLLVVQMAVPLTQEVTAGWDDGGSALCCSWSVCGRDCWENDESLRRLLDREPRRDLDRLRLERSCLRDLDPLVDVDLSSSSELSEDEDSSLVDLFFRRVSRLERCSSFC